ncbi:uncharacterized protein ASPGLDRAFT_197213 [Aspergillus glaucus CBS 516.65]|uniref:Uncharacterized protein n=1 Tax=Aspergillus glaucus CBS 516.65 TaxID=1160497 RepID=A0A1L9VYV3_ASPGL|nr:hypothetical protein ASPGLDRAFT_197213 [Aspergillus glaucus CBS 516.65]OJJ89098.1 hypothetical protein ASPGLDRAFT_197213 [Aspergillus glaucus CBS 516.65]
MLFVILFVIFLCYFVSFYFFFITLPSQWYTFLPPYLHSDDEDHELAAGRRWSELLSMFGLCFIFHTFS